MKKLFILLAACLLIGCTPKDKEVSRVVVETDVIQGVNYLMVCEKVNGHIESETCFWHYDDFTPAPFEYNPDYQVPLLGDPLGVRSV